MRPFHLIYRFMKASFQEEAAYRVNFYIRLLHSLLNLLVGVVGVGVLFYQVQSLQGWSYSQAMALLGVYLLIGSLRGLFIGPSLESLAGLGREIWTGNFDFTLLRPVDTQFLVTFRQWRFFALVDLILGIGVITSSFMSSTPPGLLDVVAFLFALAAGTAVLYAILLIFTSLVFWGPGFLFTWVFDALFQLARYPVGIYPPWLRFILTWLIPVGMMTTIPAEFLTGSGSLLLLGSSLLTSGLLVLAASLIFHRALRRYTSASS
ncbi:MAG TPA: ABC-2 family transporter protein [Anaerolineaceae bacterium]